jgi:predicted alpha-1,2-mannosidase
MTTSHGETRPTADQRDSASRKSPLWKRVLKIVLGLVVMLVLLGATSVGLLALQYHRIISAKPGKLHTRVQALELGRQVNPFIGTGGYPWVCGNNFPGAMAPLGMVRLGPETTSLVFRKRALNTSGYYYGDEQLLGFSHTRLNGTGATDGGHFLVLPTAHPAEPQLLREWPPTRFSHSEELASPGYYAVRLPQPGVLVELTATPRVGIHRYTFNDGKAAHLLLDVMNALGGRRATEGTVRVLPEAGEIEGSVKTFGTFAARYGGIKVYSVAKLSQPLAAFACLQDNVVWGEKSFTAKNRARLHLSFAPTNGTQVITLKLAISFVSIENARSNLQAEADGKSFDQLLAEAQRAWEDKLSAVRVAGGTATPKEIFYTALFRVFEMPTLFNDANGDYLGFDRQIHKASGFQYFTDLSLWDTFRTTHPLYTLIAPEDQRNMLVSLVRMLEEGGWLPRWPSGHGYSNSMLGTPADIVISESYLKGVTNFDVGRAYEGMRRTALQRTPPGAAFPGREGVEAYVQYGYCLAGQVGKSVSRTLEYSWADYAISLLAESLGKTEDATLFRKHAQSYRNVWNPATQYFQPRDARGQFVEPFKPLLLPYFDRKGKYTKDYVEGSALQWRWGAPFDAEGMIALFKNREYFVDELNRFFAKSDPAMGAWNPGPYYWHGNQPDIHAAYLFNDAGRPDLTQKWSRWIMEHKYGTGYDGLDGNDDAGTLSAWYVLSALGLYPVAGTDKYELGTPLFAKAEVRLADAPLTIVAQNYALDRSHVSKVLLNGTPLDRWWIRHSEIARGGELRFVMSATPSER